MTGYEHREFTVFQVDRPVVEGGDPFVRQLEELGKELGSVTTTALTQTVLPFDSDPDELKIERRTRPLDEPLLDVFRQNQLRLVLYRRAVAAENRKSFLLSAMEHRAQHDLDLLDVVKNISTEPSGNGHYSRLICDRAAYFNDPVFGKTLSLLPEDSDRASIDIQANTYRKIFDEDAPELGKDTVSESGVIPVASLANSVGETEAQRFLDIVNSKDILPIKLAVGGIKAYKSYELSNYLQVDSSIS